MLMKGMCDKCLKLYEQKVSRLSDYCLHCYELVLKSFLIEENKEIGDNVVKND